MAVSLGLSELQISRDYQRSPGTMGTLASNKTQTRFPRISGLCCFLEKTKAHFLTEKAAVRIIDYRWQLGTLALAAQSENEKSETRYQELISPAT